MHSDGKDEFANTEAERLCVISLVFPLMCHYYYSVCVCVCSL